MKETEKALWQFLKKEKIAAKFGADVPKLLNRDTGRRNGVDFFLPGVDLHIEVKGHMTLDAIRKMVSLARSTPRYYLYQHRDWDWRPDVLDWPEGVLSKTEAATISGRAKRAREAYVRLHPPRTTKAGFYKGEDVVHARAVQEGEILLMASRPQIAAASSQMMRTRLDRYLCRGIEDLRVVGLDVNLVQRRVTTIGGSAL